MQSSCFCGETVLENLPGSLPVCTNRSSDAYSLPATGGAKSPDNRLKSSRAEAAEEREEVALLLAAGGAEEPEIREQPRREWSVVRGSGGGRRTYR